MRKPPLTFWQIWNMSFGFLGIQFGWGLQQANMSAIYEKLGAEPDRIPLLWLAAPLTGLLIQPLIGAMSDHTWTSLGRRRPYFLGGAILSSLALLLMPTVPLLWMAAGLLWVLDASINITMEPFRAFVADKLDEDQRTSGFVMQSFFIGIGAALSSALPYFLRQLGIVGTTTSGIPLTVKYAFQLGAVAFLAAVVWTVFTSSEEPPPEKLVAAAERREAEHTLEWEYAQHLKPSLLNEIFHAMQSLPPTMKQLAIVQIFTWLGLFCMWLFFGLMTARHVFGATDPRSTLYSEGVEWGGLCFSVYSVVCFLVAFALPYLATATSRKFVHAFCLICGGLGLLSVYFIQNKYLLFLSMAGVGIAWASILSMPYAMLAGCLPPQRLGLYMGIFNFFIVIPEIFASLTFQPLVRVAFNNNPLYVVMLGGACMLIAALSVTLVREDHQPLTAETANQTMVADGIGETATP
jgi:maltose/moltooligosaccharide transporter